MDNPLIEHVKEKFSPADSGPLLIGVSGGVDSMVLLDILASFREVVVAHINYGTRQDSDEDERLVRQAAAARGLTFENRRAAPIQAGNFQEEARKIRMEFFQDVAERYDARLVALGHHLDDQIETFLMRLIKGTDLSALTGMSERTSFASITLVRPFLDVSKRTLLEYAKKKQIPYREDPSNQSSSYMRNRIRKHILPAFEKENPAFKNTALELLEELREADKLVDEAASEHLSDVGGQSVKRFLDLPGIVQARILKKMFTPLPQSPGRALKDEIVRQLRNGGNFIYPLQGGSLIKEYDRFRVEADTSSASKFYVEISGPGTYSTPEGMIVVGDEKISRETSKTFELWYNEITSPIVLRTRRAGDRLQLPQGTKKLKDVFIDRKIPPSARDRTLVLAVGENVIWVPEYDIRAVPPGDSRYIYTIYFIDSHQTEQT